MNASGVLVCGAGPVGLTAALELARHGVRPRVIDAKKGPSTLSKALILWRRTLMGLDAEVPFERFLEGHFAPTAAKLYASGKELSRIDLKEGEPASPPGMPIGVLLPQSDTEQILLKALAAHGIEVEWETRLESLHAMDSGVDVTIESSTGSEEGGVGWVLGCDGAHSTVRHCLGVDFPGSTSGNAWLISDIDIDQEGDPTVMRIEFSPEGTVAIFPVAKNRWRVIADMGEQLTESKIDPTMSDVQRVLDGRTSTGWKVTKSHWLSNFTVNERQVEQYCHGRVFLAGDAAHVHSPAGGQGMNTGIQDALNVAWKLALVMRGGADPRLLQTYQQERHSIGEHVVQASGRLLKAATLSNKLAQAARNTIVHLAMGVPAIRHRFRGALAEEDLHYRRSLLVDGSGTRRLQSGDIFPNTLVEVDGELVSIYNLLRGHCATVVVVGTTTPLGIPERFGLDDAGLPIEICRIGPGGDATDPDGTTSGLLGGNGSIVLVRPDGVVATMAHSVESIAAWISDRLVMS